MNPSSEMIGELYISGKNIFWSTHVYKNRERKNYVKAKRKNKEPIMGFGHRVYRTEDPRAKHLKNS